MTYRGYMPCHLEDPYFSSSHSYNDELLMLKIIFAVEGGLIARYPVTMATHSHDYNANCASGHARQYNGDYNNNSTTNNYTQPRSLHYDASKHAQLLIAAAEGQTGTVSRLIRDGADCDHKDEEGRTALHFAALHGHVNTVTELIAQDVYINARSKVYGTPICLAALKGHARIVKALLDAGAIIDSSKDKLLAGHFGSALHAACAGGSEEVVTLIRKAGLSTETLGTCDFDTFFGILCPGHRYSSNFIALQTYDIECNPLLPAAMFGKDKVLNTLLNAGATPNQMFNFSEGTFNTTALIEAAAGGHVRAVDTLIERGAYVNTSGYGRGTALGQASKRGSLECVTTLIAAGAEIDFTHPVSPDSALRLAILNGHAECVRVLLDNNAYTGAVTGFYEKATMTAALNGQPECLQILLKHDPKSLSNELFGGACYGGNIECVDYLYKCGAAVNVQPRSKYPEIPLIQAVRGGHLKVVKKLLDWHANVNLEDEQGKTACDYAMTFHHDGIRDMLRVRDGKYKSSLIWSW